MASKAAAIAAALTVAVADQWASSYEPCASASHRSTSARRYITRQPSLNDFGPPSAASAVVRISTLDSATGADAPCATRLSAMDSRAKVLARFQGEVWFGSIRLAARNCLLVPGHLTRFRLRFLIFTTNSWQVRPRVAARADRPVGCRVVAVAGRAGHLVVATTLRAQRKQWHNPVRGDRQGGHSGHARICLWRHDLSFGSIGAGRVPGPVLRPVLTCPSTEDGLAQCAAGRATIPTCRQHPDRALQVLAHHAAPAQRIRCGDGA